MAKKSDKPKEPKPWDRKPWPKRGNRTGMKLYAAVGRALSSWEGLERELGVIFSLLVAGSNTKSARRAYYAVRTFEGRSEMLRAASEAFFAERENIPLQDKFKELFSAAKSFSPRRNDIAHGAVNHFIRDPAVGPFKRFKTFALYPSFANYKDRALDSRPTYCYTSIEIDRYTFEFRGLIFSAGYLMEEISMELEERRELAEKADAETIPS